MKVYNNRIIRPTPISYDIVETGDIIGDNGTTGTLLVLSYITLSSSTVSSSCYPTHPNSKSRYFLTPVNGGTYTFVVNGGQGSSSPTGTPCGASCNGFGAERITFTGFIPGNRKVLFYVGNLGGNDEGCVAEDCTAGGSGGATYVIYEDPNGDLTWDGVKYIPVVMAKGGQAGNDACFDGCLPSYTPISISQTEASRADFITKWGINPANGTVYSRGASSYGGYPWGIGADDTADRGGGLSIHYVNNSFTVTSKVPPVGGSGYIKITGTFKSGGGVIA